MNIFFDKEKFLKLFCVAGLTIFLDQLTKYLTVKNISLYSNIEIIDGLFNLTYVQNPGGAFGFLAQQSDIVRAVVFIFVSSLALILIGYFYYTTPKEFSVLSTGFALIFGGAIGNLIDRIRFGKVVDFLDVYIGNYHWPAFNIADSAICVGVIIFSYHILFKKMPE